MPQQDQNIVPETFATKQQVLQLASKLGVDVVNTAADTGAKAGRKRKKQKMG